MEAPYIYAAVDALAVRAGKWAERRQRLLMEASPDDLAAPTPEAAASVAIAAVKEVRIMSLNCLDNTCHPFAEYPSFVLITAATVYNALPIRCPLPQRCNVTAAGLQFC